MSEPVRVYELKTDDGKVIRWPGTSGEDAARRAADAKGVTIVASRVAASERYGIFVLGAGEIIG